MYVYFSTKLCFWVERLTQNVYPRVGKMIKNSKKKVDSRDPLGQTLDKYIKLV